MKTLLTTMLIAFSLGAVGQSKQKWDLTSWGTYRDTVTRGYSLRGDSVSVTTEKSPCNCTVWIDFDGKRHDAKGIVRWYLETHQWNLVKTFYYYHKKLIRKDPEHWESNGGMSNFVDGVYFQNGKFIQPQYIIYKGQTFKVD